MTIDRSRELWVGSEGADLDAYLRELTAESYPARRVAHAKCGCGSDRFRLRVDAEQGGAERTCAACSEAHLLCDSDEMWDDAEPEDVICPCGASEVNVAAAFSERDDGSIKWITVGARCTTCGVLGSPVDWKIDYEPTDHLFARV